MRHLVFKPSRCIDFRPIIGDSSRSFLLGRIDVVFFPAGGIMENLFPIRRADVKSTVLPDGSLVIADEQTEWALTLNPVGAAVWEFCDGSLSVDCIIGEVHNLVKDLDGQLLTNEVSSLIDELAKSGFLIFDAEKESQN